MISLKDIKVDGSDFEISLSKLIGKKIKDVKGYLANEFGQVSFKLTELVFEDDTKMGIEGEHDFPYLSEYSTQKQPNFDDETLEKLHEEGNK